MARLDKPSWRAQVTNRAALYKRIDMEGVTAQRTIDATLRRTLGGVVQEGYARQMFEVQKGAGVGWAFDLPNTRQADAVLRRVLDARYTENLTRRHTERLKETIAGGIISGKGERDIAKDVHAEAGGEIWEAKRLVRTEITAAAAAGETEALKDAGIERYRFYATLDERTCPVCGSMDAKEFPVGEGREGESLPPMHPNCRCVITAAIGEAEKAVRRGRGEDGKGKLMPPGMTYRDWRREYGKSPDQVAARGAATGMPSTAGDAGAATATTAAAREDVPTSTTADIPKFKLKDIKDRPTRMSLAALGVKGELPMQRNSLPPRADIERNHTRYPEKLKVYDEVEHLLKNPPACTVGEAADFKRLNHWENERLADGTTKPLLDGSKKEEYLVKSLTEQPSQFNKPLFGEISNARMEDVEKIKGMTELISKSELKEGIVVYNGRDGRNIYIRNPQKGDVTTINSFMSTSTEPSVAHRFAKDKEVPLMLKILVPPSKGVALPIGHLTSATENEYEILLQRGMRLEYIGREINHGGVPVFIYKVVP